MSAPWEVTAPLVSSVFHPSDFSPASARAFAHALAVALIRRTELVVLHAGRENAGKAEWTRFPGVRATLTRWGLLEPGSPRSAVFEQLQIRVTKVSTRGTDPFAATLEFLRRHDPDLIVLSTEGRRGLPRWLHPSAAEKLARASRTMTLFVPDQARGFVSLEDGRITLRRILVPVDAQPAPSEALRRTKAIAEAVGDRPVAVRLLHVGEGPLSSWEPPDGDACTWHPVQRRGDAALEILAEAQDFDPDLIVMATAGREGIVDAVRGSVTEQVLRAAPCPLLAIPAR